MLRGRRRGHEATNNEHCLNSGLAFSLPNSTSFIPRSLLDMMTLSEDEQFHVRRPEVNLLLQLHFMLTSIIQQTLLLLCFVREELLGS